MCYLEVLQKKWFELFTLFQLQKVAVFYKDIKMLNGITSGNTR